jgi:hypothetical protein
MEPTDGMEPSAIASAEAVTDVIAVTIRHFEPVLDQVCGRVGSTSCSKAFLGD